jgi:nitrogenase molybdenum-iron protein beta chain
VYRGYELFLNGIISQLEPDVGALVHTIPGLINILGIVPTQDVYWEGNLDEISSLLASIDLRANSLFGYGTTVEGLHNLRHAQLSLVFSPWGLDAARELESRFGIPWINFNVLPVGADESAKLLEAVSEALAINPDSARSVSIDLRKREGHFLNKLADAYFIQGWQRECAIVAGSSSALGISTFLTTTLGLLPSLVIITDNPADQYRLELTETVKRLLPGFGTRILFSEDRGEISDAIQYSSPEIILGSSLEQDVAHRLNIPLVEVSFPVTGQVVLNKRHAGLRGALNLLEDIGRTILAILHGVHP